MERYTRPTLEYNLAGGILRTLDKNSFEGLLRGLHNAGYEAASILPFRALIKNLDPINQSPLKIVHLEEAWNPTNQEGLVMSIVAGLIGHYKRLRGDKTQPPILQDSLFPSQRTCNRLFDELLTALPEVKFIDHKINLTFPQNRLLIGINPGIQMSLPQLLALSEEHGFGLVFDPRHMFSTEKVISLSGNPSKPYKGEWENQFNTASRSGKIEVVDIGPLTKTEMNELFSGRGMFKELATAATEAGIHFIRVKVPIPVGTQILGSPFLDKGFEFIKEVGQAIRE